MSISAIPVSGVSGAYGSSIPPEYQLSLMLNKIGFENISFGSLGRKKNNIVRNPPNVRGMTQGTLSLSESLDGMPSAKISYENVPQNEIKRYMGYYEPGDRVSLAGEKFLVERHGYTRNKYGNERGRLKVETYTVSASLIWVHQNKVDRKVYVGDLLEQQVATGKGEKEIEVSASQIASKVGIGYSGPGGKVKITSEYVSLSEIISQLATMTGRVAYYHGNQVQLKKLGAGSNSFGDDEIIADGENSMGLPSGIKDLRVTIPPLNEGQDDEGDNLDDQPSVNFERETFPKIRLPEGDDDPSIPPEGSVVLRSLDSCHDASGPTKVEKYTEIVNGTTVAEFIQLWGFEYTAANIHAGDGLLLAAAEDFWMPIENKKTTYEYKKIGGIGAEISVIDTNNPGQRIPIIIHPDYKNIIGEQNFVNLEGRYLVAIRSRGWKSVRLKQETDALETLYPDDPYFSKYQFRHIPLSEETKYSIKSAKNVYGDEEGNGPFSVSVTSSQSADERVKEELRKLYFSDSPDRDANFPPNVAIVTADPNYMEPLLVLEETQFTDCFLAEADPLSVPENPLPPLITGSESYRNVRNQPIGKGIEKYRQTETQWSFQEAGFNHGAEQSYSREMLGRPPGASTMSKASWEQKQTPPDERRKRIGSDQAGVQNQERIYIVNARVNKNAQVQTGTGSLPEGIENVSDIKKYFETQLTIQNLSIAQASKTIAWENNSVQVGERARFGADLFSGKGNWIISGISRDYRWNGIVHPYSRSRPMCTTDGVKLSLGMDFNQGVTVTEKKSNSQPNKEDPNNPTANNFEIEVKLTGGGFSASRNKLPPSTRRNFTT